ncbi:hypothetical protein RG484_001609 [Morganella morganii]|nr:hypothetical protein [Morganella morganii]HAE76493.1 hypothetical protein [Morganella sp. (in: enterobacteria)]HDU8718191.1 hypothetical protein [Morganella morganii subsp. morganii]
MGKKQVDLMYRFIEKERNTSLDKLPPVPVSGKQASEFLWPLNARFKNKYELIKTATYLCKYEKPADKAIENYVFLNDSWDKLPLHVWRVLLERQIQALMLFTASDLHQPSVMSVPIGLTADQNTKFAALFWLHGMKLPFPVDQQLSADFFSTHPDLPLISH